MGRARRYISDDGKLLCPLCEQWVHITGYSTRKLLGGGEDFIEDVWFEEKGIEYGKPQGYCRPCMSAASQGRGAMVARKEKVRKELAGEVTVDERTMSLRDQMDRNAKREKDIATQVEYDRLVELYGPPDQERLGEENYIHDIDKAWVKAHYEWNRRDVEVHGFPVE